MKISIVSFTKQGEALAETIKSKLRTETVSSYARHGKQHEKGSLAKWTGEQFAQKNAIVFIGACGIAVRAIAPFVCDKLSDSPVLVIDELGKYVIALLSGHVGGANALAETIAKEIGAAPVITTATDINKKFAVDVFAVKNGLAIVNREGIAEVSSRILDRKKVRISIEGYEVEELIGFAEEIALPKREALPSELELVGYPPGQETEIVISTSSENIPGAVLQLKPKEYVLGIGCRRGKSFEELQHFIKAQLQQFGITEEEIAVIASIDKKADEEGILRWKDYYRIPFVTFSENELSAVQGNFHSSDFVKKSVGVDNVCERAAMAACDGTGKLVLEKQAENGMTLALAKRAWKLSWD